MYSRCQFTIVCECFAFFWYRMQTESDIDATSHPVAVIVNRLIGLVKHASTDMTAKCTNEITKIMKYT